MQNSKPLVNGQKLRKLRNARNLTQTALGQAVNKYLHRHTLDEKKQIYRYERGGRIERDYLRALAGVLQVTPDELIVSEDGTSLSFISGANQEEKRLLEKSLDCYEELFPDPMQRDSREDIKTWLTEVRRAKYTGDPWGGFWGVLHREDCVMGISYFSVHRDYPWAFGSYFGIRQEWRNSHYTERFLEDAISYLRSTIPTLKGLIFETDSIEFEYLEKLSLDQDRVTVDERLSSNLEAIKKLRFYQEYSAYPVLAQNDLPLPYWLPSIDDDFNEGNEKELILMVKIFGTPFQISDIKLKDIIDFVYDKVYTDAYDAEIGSVKIKGYGSYVANIKRRVEENMKGGASIGPLPHRISRNMYRLFTIARKNGLEE